MIIRGPPKKSFFKSIHRRGTLLDDEKMEFEECVSA